MSHRIVAIRSVPVVVLVLGLGLVLGLLGCNASIGSEGGSASTEPKPDSGVPGDPTEPTTPAIPVSDPGSCGGCSESRVGAGGGEAFDPASHESEFVARDTDGALIIDMKSGKLTRYLWVADTSLPGVVKIDLSTMKIVGRYITGGASTSRTTVNALGEAFIGARENGSKKAGVTKVLPLGKDCPDTNGDGVVTTSSGQHDVLPYGKDDCVVWHTETDGDIRGLAAQDIPGLKHEDACQGFNGDSKEFNPKEVTSEDQHYIWVGGTHGKVYKIDAQTGKILIKTTAPLGVYGMALAGDGKLWVGAGGGGFGFVDTTKCKDQASCDATQVCAATCTTATCPSTCDNATKTHYSGVPGGYGITVDSKQRVWRSGYPNAMTMRYDPQGPATSRLGFSATGGWGGGIAVDADGWVWAAHNQNGKVVRVNADTLAGTVLSIPSKGIAVDAQGRVFSIQYDGAVHMIQPGKTLADNTITMNAVALKGIAYAYSDMTGMQTRLASGEPGWYREVFEPCQDGKAEWQFLTWDVTAPTGTWVMFNVRSADTALGLKKAPWFTMACIAPPGGKGSAKIQSIKTKLIEVEARFIATGDLNKPNTLASAKIKSFGVMHRCVKLD